MDGKDMYERGLNQDMACNKINFIEDWTELCDVWSYFFGVILNMNLFAGINGYVIYSLVFKRICQLHIV